MNKAISILSIAALVGAAFTSCNTDDGPMENQAPTVTIMEPSMANNPHMSGQSLHIHVEFADDIELHEAAVSVVREHDATEVFHHQAHTHDKSYVFMVDTVLTTAMHSDFVVTATVSDHDGEIATDSETIHMHPM